MFQKILLIATVALVAGCSDPKAATEKNFKVVIQKTLDKAYPRCYITGNFPAVSDKFMLSKEKELKALVSAGLASVKDEPHEVKDWRGKTSTDIKPTYSLTEEGKKFYKADAHKAIMGGTEGGICFGKGTVKDIKEFTEPSSAGGVQMTQVKYTYEVSDVPAWAKSAEILTAVPRLKQDVESEKMSVDGMDVMVLTNNGWASRGGGMGF